ncbi:MAG TPA: class I SAM-dependent methyltransferase [Anaerolineales bacterium]|nr:class I SAM-dependent methyltransferase [Anaerolineales bacterium]
MTIRIDPEQREVRALRRVATWRGKRVLEVGCGDGRLSVRLARLGAIVVAIDPESSLIRIARRNLPPRYASRVRFRVGTAERMPHDGPFDAVIFSWSL